MSDKYVDEATGRDLLIVLFAFFLTVVTVRRCSVPWTQHDVESHGVSLVTTTTWAAIAPLGSDRPAVWIDRDGVAWMYSDGGWQRLNVR